jgi:hypothetical protein
MVLIEDGMFEQHGDGWLGEVESGVSTCGTALFVDGAPARARS